MHRHPRPCVQGPEGSLQRASATISPPRPEALSPGAVPYSILSGLSSARRPTLVQGYRPLSMVLQAARGFHGFLVKTPYTERQHTENFKGNSSDPGGQSAENVQG